MLSLFCFLPLFLQPVVELGSTAFWVGLFGAIAFAWFTVRRKSLSIDGAIAAAWVGLWVMFFAGPLWLLPLFFFFISSTLLGRLNKRTQVQSDVKHGKARDYKQVLCNGGIYALLASFAGPTGGWPLWLMAVSIAISTADTWSSEYGIYRKGATYDILRLKPIPAGVSGGVSVAGTMAGLLGAASTALVVGILVGEGLNWYGFSVITLGGFGGMLLDSVLGAGVQARYRDEQGAISDTGDIGARLYSGWRFISNDGVNLWSNALITAITYWIVCR
ncbi:MAG: DUF92 domain-containing protein [Bacteroidota bacterium]